MEVNFTSADWKGYLRAQMTVFAGGVCLRSKQIFSARAVFSKQFFNQKEAL